MTAPRSSPTIPRSDRPSPPADPPARLGGSRRAAALAALLAIATLLLIARPAHTWLLDQLAVAETVIREREALGMVVFVVLAALSAMLAFLSSAVLVPVAIYVWGPAVCAALLWLGWLLGGLTAYAIGRFLGRPIVERLVRPEALARHERWAGSRRSLPAIVLLQLAVPSDLAGYVLGLIRCPVLPFAGALALAEVPYAVGAVFLGVSFLEGRVVPLLLLGAAGVLLSLLALRAHQRRTASTAAR